MGARAYVTSSQLLVLILLASAHSETSSQSAAFCAESFTPPLSPPSSVNSLTPRDVSVVSALGLSTKHRADQTWIIRGLSGVILSAFNPAVTTLLPEESNLLEEAEHLAHSLNNNEWKLLLLFVPVDELTTCQGQASSAVDSAVQKVEEALDKLHEKLQRTLVHVVVWGGHADDRASHCQQEEEFGARPQNWNRLERATLMTVLQESLAALLQRRVWWSDREDFSVALQSSPTYIGSSGNSIDVSGSSHLSETLIQLWTKLLQSMEAKSDWVESGSIPCPSQERPYLLTQHNSPRQLESHESLHSTEHQPTPFMGTSLSCTHKSPSPSVPTSVNALRPADIKVVGAIGDSLTAANGVGAAPNNLLDVMIEYRGLSWSIGGDNSLSSVTTLANILRQFNPSLTGFSTGQGKATTTQAFLNQAVAGAKSEDLVSQARALVTRMKGDSRINFQNDWKVITVFIGGNDLCAYCTNTAYYSANNFGNRIRDALDIFHKEVPRALVNLVEVMYIVPLRKLHQDSSLGCPTWLVNDICSCVVKPAEGSSELQALMNMNRAYQSSTRNLVNSGRYNTRSDFTVVLQPFPRDMVIPLLSNGKPDRTYFAPDCFHLSQKSQALMARALWNNMLEPVSSKTSSLNFQAGVTAKCPSSSTHYLATSGNSKSTYVDAVPQAALPSERSSQSAAFCAESFTPSHSPPSSVHSLTPGDVSVVSALGLSTKHRSDHTWILHGLSEILSGFNSAVTTLLPEESNMLEEAEHLAHSLNNNEWKLLLLFVPVDELNTCPGQASSAVDSAVHRVEEALDKLHEKLQRTLVHVVVWGGHADDITSHCQQEEEFGARAQNWNRLERATLMTVLQESLAALLQRRVWWSDREDFSVVLQSSPTYIDTSGNTNKIDDVSGSSHLSETLIQLWTKLLQSMEVKSDLEGSGIVSIPCPSQERPYLLTQHNSARQLESHESLHSTEHQPTPFMGTSLSCTHKSPSPSVPTSVNALRPADIKVVGAIGDSLTAANGVGAAPNNLLDVMIEYRGLSWSIGGDNSLSSVTTLANILRQFNPSLTGFSTGQGKATTTQAFLNQAVAGAKSEDLVSQARALVTRMKGNSRINFQNDWKVITVFIGGNDLCAYCTNTAYYSANNFANRIRDALDIFHKEVPRALVNLVEVMYIVPLRKLHQDSSLGCPTWLVNDICPCVVKPAEGSSELQALMNMNRAYQSSTRNLVNSGRYNTRSDFTVVLQPFPRDMVIPLLSNGKPDRTYFAPDCFHLSQKSQALMARALWNNMLEPVSSKTSSLNFQAGVTAKCPSSSTHYLATSGNSKSAYVDTVPRVALPPNWGSDFSCKNIAPSDTVPASVHKLRPGDIKVVASLGDSITAGFGAKATNILQLVNEERGVSWSIGGDETLETVTTVPNILKKFNPNVFGFSKGLSRRPNGLNMAVSGAKASGIPGQVRDLIEALRNSTSVDFEQDWKLVTLFIGGNDLCQYCRDRVSLSPTKYIEHIQDALDMLYNEVPRLLVNFVEILQIEGLRQVKSNTLGCSLQPALCPCFLGPEENSEELFEMKRINREMQTRTERLVFSGRYDNRDDFAVVIQPFFQTSVVPMGTDKQPDLSFFSVDCFHFKERGHAEMAIALWNNMLEPVGSKQSYNNFTHDRSKIKCPSEEHPFIFTRVNSFATEPTGLAGTTSIIDPTPSGPKNSVPSWTAVLLAIGGLMIGVAATWMVMHCRERRKRQKNEKLNLFQMNGTPL